MKLKATDTLHVSSVGPDNILPGDVFEVSDDVGRQLVERGLASATRAKAPGAKADEAPADTKADRAPLNKMDIAPANKTVSRRVK